MNVNSSVFVCLHYRFLRLFLLDHCSFDDESLCQMSVSSAADYSWQRVKSLSGINVTDHTYLGQEQNGEIYYSQSVNGKCLL